MNKIITTAGLLAIGALSVEAQQFQNTTSQKPWAVSATLRGFWDDNNLTLPDNDIRKEDTFGVEVSPSAGYNIVRDQTTIGLNYVYSMRWFEAREEGDIDHTHVFNAKLSHAFTERYKLDVTDSFVFTKEPTVFNEDFVVLPIRSDSDAIRNTARLSFSAGVAENTDVVLGYQNRYIDFDEEGEFSRSAVLDSINHLFTVNLRQVILPKTIGVVGYQFGITDYTGDDFISGNVLIPKRGPGVYRYRSDIRDNYNHYLYVGVDQSVTSTLNLSARVGAMYTYYRYAEANGLDEDQWSPYVDFNGTWNYLPGSYLQVGVKHERVPTDVSYLSGNTPNMDVEATTVYGSLSHKITSMLTGSLIAQYQHSTYEDGIAGGLEDASDDYVSLGLNLTYDINRFLALETGYNFDLLDSDLADFYATGREFERNRVYVGVRATY